MLELKDGVRSINATTSLRKVDCKFLIGRGQRRKGTRVGNVGSDSTNVEIQQNLFHRIGFEIKDDFVHHLCRTNASIFVGTKAARSSSCVGARETTVTVPIYVEIVQSRFSVNVWRHSSHIICLMNERYSPLIVDFGLHNTIER